VGGSDVIEQVVPKEQHEPRFDYDEFRYWPNRDSMPDDLR
jgi:hypothetical protein